MSTLTALYIVLGIFIIFLSLAFLRIHLDIECNDDITANLRILCIKFALYPKNKRRANLGKFKKGYPKENAKKASPSDKKTKNKSSDGSALGEKIDTVITLVKILFSRFFRHLRLDVSKILITVGGSDAAKAAITYGVISQSVAYLLEFLDSRLKISKKRKGQINVFCDFTSETVTYDISISASLSIWQLLDIGISLAYNYFKGKDIFHLMNSD